MQKLDRLGWAAGISIRAFGVRIGVRVNDPEALGRLEGYFPPGWRLAASPTVDLLYSLVVGGVGTRPGVRRFHLLYANASRLGRSLHLDDVYEGFEHYLHLHVAELARRRLFVHAGVVGWKGRAIVLPGRSRAGKSSLVAALVRAGATYYSDEYAVFDAQGRVHPYPRPLSLRHGDGTTRTRHPTAELGWHPGTKPLPVGLVAVTEYMADAPWRPRRLSPGHGALALLANTIAARLRPAQTLTTLQRVAGQARLIKGRRGEADVVAPRLLETLDRC
jgi:hypothetical protein